MGHGAHKVYGCQAATSSEAMGCSRPPQTPLVPAAQKPSQGKAAQALQIRVQVPALILISGWKFGLNSPIHVKHNTLTDPSRSQSVASTLSPGAKDTHSPPAAHVQGPRSPHAIDREPRCGHVSQAFALG